MKLSFSKRNSVSSQRHLLQILHKKTPRIGILPALPDSIQCGVFGRSPAKSYFFRYTNLQPPGWLQSVTRPCARV